MQHHDVEALPLIVTRHAVQRCRQRLGLKRRAVARTAERALKDGRRSDSAGHGHVDPDAIFRLWLDHMFVFRRAQGRITLITVTPRRPRLTPDEDRARRIVRREAMGRRSSWEWRR
jgi:hypothetical protein